MPTGYTCDIKNGITFNEFVMGCARAFGACITMRDDPSDATIPDEFKPDCKYYDEELQKENNKLARVKALTPSELHKEVLKDFEKQTQQHEQSLQEELDLLNKYNDMLIQAIKWEPPTKDHIELKKFMIEQIKTSIKHDCDIKWTESRRPILLSDADWLDNQIKDINWSIDYHTEERQKEITRAKERTAWIKALRKSLEPKKETK